MRRIVSGVSWVLLVLFACLWVRSHKICDDIWYVCDDGSQIEVWTYPGRINYVNSEMPLDPVRGWHSKSEPQWADESTDFLRTDKGVRLAGFVFVRDPYPNSKYHEFHAVVPFWFPIVLASVLPSIGLLRILRRTRLWPARPKRPDEEAATIIEGGRGQRAVSPDLPRVKLFRFFFALFLFVVLVSILRWTWGRSHVPDPARAEPATGATGSTEKKPPQVRLPAATNLVTERLKQLQRSKTEMDHADVDQASVLRGLLAEAIANDSVANGKYALATLDELLRLDPDHVEASELRDKISGYSGPIAPWSGPAVVTNSVGMKLAYIAPATFTMGTPLSEPGRSREDEPPHQVTLSRGFFMSVTHITVGQFRAFVEETGYKTDAEKGQHLGSWDDCYEQAEDHPVVWMSWNDATAFADWLSKKEKKKYHLPTEAQFEYCCRAGTNTVYPWGNDPDGGQGWANCMDLTFRDEIKGTGGRIDTFNWRDGYIRTSPVGSFRPNTFGLYDMIGNAWQWCSNRAMRGGSWSAGPRNCRCGWRHDSIPSIPEFSAGFRLVMDRTE